MTPAPERRSPADGDTIGRNTVFAFATQVITAVFTAAITVYLVRALGPAGFGVFTLAVSIGGLLRRPSDVGTTQSAARFVAEHHGDTVGVTGVLGMALPMRMLTAGAIGVVLFALAGPISSLYNTPELAWPLRAVAISFVGQSVMRFVVVIFVAMRRTSSGFWLVFSESATEFTATVALVLLGGGAAGAAFGRAAGYTLGAVLGVFLLGRLLGRSPLIGTGPSPVSRREFVSYAGSMFVVAGAFSVFAALDVLLIGAFLGTAAVGVFSAPMRLITFLGFLGLAVAQGVAPRLARHPGQRPQVRALERAIRYVLVVQGMLIPLITVWAEPIVELALGSEFSESIGILRGLAPYLFLTGIAPLLVAPLNYMGEGRRRIPVAIGAVLLNLVVDVILIPELGILGAVIGTNVAYAFFIGAHVWLSHKLIGISLRRLSLTVARTLVASAVMAGVLALFGTESLSTIEWLAGLATGLGAFMTVIIVSRELSVAEIRRLAALPARALRRD
ncbi:MAG: polysaccharide biosynthesis protein [Solirubrobacterales bacterium]|nr:polysaccharide biosynthesis protein [Solirubrobacterales bacterium]